MSLNLFSDFISIKDQIDWRLSRLAMTHSTEVGLPTSSQHQTEMIFKLKSIFHLLPTLDYLKKTQPHLYNTTDCPLCNKTEENWFHIYTCPSQQIRIQKCIESSIQRLIIDLSTHIDDIGSFSNDLSGLTIWTLPNTSHQMTRNFDLTDLLQGMIPFHLKNFISNNCSPPLGSKHLDQALINFQSSLLNEFHTNVWNFRNNTLKDLQRNQGISNSSLKTKFHDRDRSIFILTHRSSQLTPSDNYFPDTINRIILDFIDFGSRLFDIY
jgi:hypothetical protein